MNITLLKHYRGKGNSPNYLIPFFYTHEHRDEFTGIYFTKTNNRDYSFGIQINNVEYYQFWTTDYLVAKREMLEFMNYIKKSIDDYKCDIFQ